MDLVLKPETGQLHAYQVGDGSDECAVENRGRRELGDWFGVIRTNLSPGKIK